MQSVQIAVSIESALDFVVIWQSVRIAVGGAVGVKDVASLIDPGAGNLIEHRTTEDRGCHQRDPKVVGGLKRGRGIAGEEALKH